MPMREARNVWRTSAVPIDSSTSSGSSRPCIAARSSSMTPVDHRVVADLDALAIGDRARVADGPHVEADDDRLGRRRQHDVGLVDAADAAVDDVDRDLLLRQLGDLVLERLERSRRRRP